MMGRNPAAVLSFVLVARFAILLPGASASTVPAETTTSSSSLATTTTTTDGIQQQQLDQQNNGTSDHSQWESGSAAAAATSSALKLISDHAAALHNGRFIQKKVNQILENEISSKGSLTPRGKVTIDLIIKTLYGVDESVFIESYHADKSLTKSLFDNIRSCDLRFRQYLVDWMKAENDREEEGLSTAHNYINDALQAYNRSREMATQEKYELMNCTKSLENIYSTLNVACCQKSSVCSGNLADAAGCDRIGCGGTYGCAEAIAKLNENGMILSIGHVDPSSTPNKANNPVVVVPMESCHFRYESWELCFERALAHTKKAATIFERNKCVTRKALAKGKLKTCSALYTALKGSVQSMRDHKLTFNEHVTGMKKQFDSAVQNYKREYQRVVLCEKAPECVKVIVRQRHRKNAIRATRVIECLLNSFANERVSETEIRTCKNETHGLRWRSTSPDSPSSVTSTIKSFIFPPPIPTPPIPPPADILKEHIFYDRNNQQKRGISVNFSSLERSTGNKTTINIHVPRKIVQVFGRIPIAPSHIPSKYLKCNGTRNNSATAQNIQDDVVASATPSSSSLSPCSSRHVSDSSAFMEPWPSYNISATTSPEEINMIVEEITTSPTTGQPTSTITQQPSSAPTASPSSELAQELTQEPTYKPSMSPTSIPSTLSPWSQ